MHAAANIIARVGRILGNAQLLRAVCVIGCIGWGVGFAVFIARMDGPTDARGHEVGGDFFHFYAAGSLVLHGGGDQLYEMAAQQAEQRRILGDDSFDKLAFYVNPPVVAAVMAPLAILPYRVAFCIYSAAMLAAFLGAMRILKPLLPELESHWGIVVALSLLFYPVIRTITGGQNTALSLLLLTGAYSSLRRGRPGLAGVWIGALFFKAQLALTLCALLGLRRQWKCVATAGVVALMHYGVGAWVSGPSWPMEMSRSLKAYWPLEFAASGFSHVSWIEVCEYALPASIDQWVGVALIIATLGWIVRIWWRAETTQPAFAVSWACAVAATLLISPHTQFYDVGLLVLPVLLLINHQLSLGCSVSSGARLGLATAFVLTPAYEISTLLGFQPLIAVPLGVLAWGARIRARDS